jgi:hypothetical protein
MTFFDTSGQVGIVQSLEKVCRTQGSIQIADYLIKFSADRRISTCFIEQVGVLDDPNGARHQNLF